MSRLPLALLLLVSLSANALTLGTERPISAPAYGSPSGAQFYSALATDGNDFVALWADHDRYRLHSTHVSASGEVSKPSSLIDHDDAWGLQLFWTGDAYTALWWSNTNNAGDVKLARLGRDGKLLEPVRTVLTQWPFQGAAWNGRNFLLIDNRDGDRMDAVLLAPNGDVVKNDIAFGIEQQSGYNSVVAAGETFWIFHATQTTLAAGDWSYTIYGNRVSASGEVIDRRPIAIGNVDRPAIVA
jgi:hypothetical protein